MTTRRLASLTLVLAAACGSPSAPSPLPSAPERADHERAAPAEARAAPTPGATRSPSPDPQAKARAVLDGLRWLVRHQSPDGSWGGSFGQRCTPERTCAQAGPEPKDHYDVGLTGLALLACLRGGFTHQSDKQVVDTTTGRRHKIADVVGGGLRWLRARQEQNGAFSTRVFLYNEAIATLAVCEASRLTGDAELAAVAQRAIDFIQDAQRQNPDGNGRWGWRYAPRGEVEAYAQVEQRELFDSDSSVTAWCALALESARRAGLHVRPESMEGALAFASWASADSGLAGYLDRKGAGAEVTGPNDHFVYHPAAMSALAMSTRIAATGEFTDPFLAAAAGQIVRDPPRISEDRLSIDYYYWQAATHALARYDGPQSPRATAALWDAWNAPLSESVLALQDHTEKACSNGGWIVPDRWGSDGHGGALYATASCVMSLMEPSQR